ncbi:phosphotransferase [Streptomyces kaniharaensis]|nr:phosphotransferase [Streptomyces kaniharaensis]
MTDQENGTPVEEFDTGFLRTAVYRSGAGFHWNRSPGALRAAVLGAPSGPVRAALGTVAGGLLPALPQVRGEERRYRVPARTSAAALLLHPVSTTRTEALVRALAGAGRTLALLHALALPGEQLPRNGPPGPARLDAWMGTGHGPGAAPRLYESLRGVLGPRRWETVRQWCAGLSGGSPGDVLLHGAPGLGSLIVDGRTGAGALLTGEEVSRGPAGFDLGWILGEFTEFRMLREHFGVGSDPARLEAAREALLDGYGSLPDARTVSRTSVLRVFTHAHDFAAYMGWDDQLLFYGRQIAELVDEECAVPAP